MRHYAALWSSKENRAFVIFRDEHENDWYVETEVDDLDAARRMAEALNRQGT